MGESVMKFEEILNEFASPEEKEKTIEHYREKLKEVKKKYGQIKNLKGNEKNKEKLRKEIARYQSMIDFSEKKRV